MKNSIIFFVFLLTFCMSCAAFLPEKWEGKTKKELVQKHGAANQTFSDENGGEIYLYSSYNMQKVSVWKDNKYVYEDQKMNTTIQYFIDKIGVIYKSLRKVTPVVKISEKTKS